MTGRDLVHAQLAVAGGGALPWSQDEIAVRGHAIECRVYAERPAEGFLPDAGALLRYREPAGPGIRVDAGVVEGSVVSPAYDALLAKLVVHGETRVQALARARAALARYVVLGVRTNIGLLSRILHHPRVAAGPVDTGFLETALDDLLAEGDEDPALALAAALTVDARLSPGAPEAGPSSPDAVRDPWSTLGGWRLA